MATTLEQWQQIYDGLGELHTRQDEDMLLYQIDKQYEEYRLKDADGRELNNAYVMVTNRPLTFADRVKGALETGELQITVERDGKADTKSAKIEELLRLYLYPAVDSYLSLIDEPPLIEVLASQITIRGAIGGVVWLYADEGYLIPHVIPWDTRYIAHKIGNKGLSLAGYRTTKTKSDIEELHKHAISGDKAEVTDIWTPEANHIWVSGEDKPIKTIKTKLKYTPAIIHGCGASIWQKDSGYLKYKWESIFAPVRKICPGYNRLLTVLNTLTMRAFTNSLQFPNEQGVNATFEGNPRGDNLVNAIGPNDRFLPMPLNDIQQATVMLKSIMDDEWVFGSLPLMEYGEMSDQETVAQITTKAAKTASVLKSRRKAIELFYDDLAIMLLGQLKNKKLPNKISLKGRVITLPKVDLGEDYTIKHTLNVRSPQQDIANAALAQALERYLDLETLLEKIIQVDDPTGVIDQKTKEDVERMMPEIKALREAVRRLRSKDEEEKAEGVLIALSLGLDPEEVEEGQFKPSEAPPQGSKTLMPLMKGR